jgi:GNAT superfamily N-acetyltransferase
MIPESQMTDAIGIRHALVAEKEALEALQTRASLANPGDREALIADPTAIELPAAQIRAGQVFVAEKGGVIMGFAAIVPRSDGDMELDGLFVEPVHWRQGIGKLLVDKCAVATKSAGSAALHVIGNPHAQQFYAACDFECTGTTSTRFGEGLVFQKSV